MSNAELTKYWFDSAEKDWGVAQLLFASKKYMHCLFFGHITLEKILKGIKKTELFSIFEFGKKFTYIYSTKKFCKLSNEL